MGRDRVAGMAGGDRSAAMLRRRGNGGARERHSKQGGSEESGLHGQTYSGNGRLAVSSIRQHAVSLYAACRTRSTAS